MIELKPYRGTTASTVEKGDKTRLAGSTRTGEMAYPWYENSKASSYAFVSIVLIFVLGLGLTIGTQTPVWMCMTFAMIIAMIFIINAWWKRYLSQYVGQPSLLVSTEHARRGEAVDVLFRQPIQRDLVIDTCKVELLAREVVRYKCGTDTCTATHDHQIQTELEQREAYISAGSAYERRLLLTIPAQAMHSFAFPDNSLTWIIRVTVECRDFVTLTESYSIQVTPEVHTL